MRMSRGVPLVTVVPESPSDAVSSVSQLSPKQPLHRSTTCSKDYRKNKTPLSSPRRQSLRTMKKRQIRRSEHLQNAMDRIHQRQGIGAPSPTQERQTTNDSEVGQILEMFSTYDAVVDHLIRKNRNLKSYVRNRSDYFPSEASYTSYEVRNTLEMLRREREENLRAPSRPRPTRLGDSEAWQETYPQPRGENARPTLQHQSYTGERSWKQEQRQMDSPRSSLRDSIGDRYRVAPEMHEWDCSPAKHVNFAPDDDGLGGSRKYQPGYRQNSMPSSRTNGATYYKQRTHDLLEIMRDFQSDGVVSPKRRSLPSDSNARGIEGEKIEIPSRPEYRDPIEESNQYQIQARWCDPDPIELLRSKEDIEYELRNLSPGGSEKVGSQTTSEILSKLLPENLPPKIRASRERITQSRRNRLQILQDLKSKLKGARETAQSQQRDASRNAGYNLQKQNRCYRASLYNGPRTARPGSPERPLNMNDYDNRGRRIGSPQNVIRVDEVRVPGSRLTERRRTFSTGHADRLERRSAVRGSNPAQSRAYIQHMLDRFSARPHSAPRSTRAHDSESESYSVSPTEQARQLRAQVESVHQYSKALGLSQEKLKVDLQKFKYLYHNRNDSLNNWAQLVTSASRDGSPIPRRHLQQEHAPYPSQEGGRNSGQELLPTRQLSSVSSGDHLHYRPHRVFLPPQQRHGLLGRPEETSPMSYQGMPPRNEQMHLPPLQQIVAEFNEQNGKQNLNPRLAAQKIEKEFLFNQSLRKEANSETEPLVVNSKKNGDKVDPRKTIKGSHPPRSFSDKNRTKSTYNKPKHGIRCGDFGLVGSDDSCHAPGDLDDKYAILSAAGSSTNEHGRIFLRRSRGLVNSSSDSTGAKYMDDTSKDDAPQVAKAMEALYNDPIALPGEGHQNNFCRSPCNAGRNEQVAVQPEAQPSCTPWGTRQ